MEVELQLGRLFESLEVPNAANENDRVFAAIPIPGYESHRLGKTGSRLPALLLTTNKVDKPPKPHPVVLENLAVEYEVNCRITQAPRVVEERTFTVIQCTAVEPYLHSYFLMIATPLMMMLGPEPTLSKVATLIDGFIEIFRALLLPPKKSVQGLWGELFLIARSSNPRMLVGCWHVTPEDRYDFSLGGFRIEVKTAIGRIRQHQFSLEQLYPPTGTQVIIASILMERAGGGTSLEALITKVKESVQEKPELWMHFDRVLALSLGNSFRAALDERFDYELAMESLAFYDPAVVPKLSPEVPIGVSHVHFRSDLSNAVRLTTDEVSRRAKLFQAMQSN